MMFPKEMLYLLIVCAVLTLVGYYKFVWFMSVGYGLAVWGIGLALIVLFRSRITPAGVALCIGLMVYGLRLAGFLLLRERKNKSYSKRMDSIVKESTGEKKIPIFVSIFVWIYVAFDYVAQTSAITYRLVNGDKGGVMAWVGLVVMALGIIIESLADKQKSDAKAKDPHRFVDTGLYRIVRCPNYFGELLFWTGVTISGFGAVKGLQWIIVIIGFLLILYVMLSGAKRLEKRQNKSYGSDPEYQEYYKKTPAIFPFVPLYSLEKFTWIK